MLVPIIMGSASDLDHARKIQSELANYGIESELRIASAHKATEFCLKVLAEYEERPGVKVYITIAGRSNALSAVVDTHVTAPVIACPPYSDKYGGMDILSSLRMPSGVAPAVVTEPSGAALLAAKILSLHDPSLVPKIRATQSAATKKIIQDDTQVRST
jgi:5-(carboxyamino)imidazole ribonucleotide mutase